MLAEGVPARWGRPHPCLRLLADEQLFDGDIAGFLQRLEMGAEIAVGRADQRSEPSEIELGLGIEHIERGHDLEPHRLMNDVVGRRHQRAPTRRSHRPPATSEPPKTAAIHSSNQAPIQKYPTSVSAVTTMPQTTKKRPTHNPARM